MTRRKEHLFASELAPHNRINTWLEKVCRSIFLSFTIFGSIAYFPSVYLAYIDGLHDIIILDTAAYVVILIFTFCRRIPLKVKAVGSTALFYVLGIILIYALGPVGAGNLWLLAFSLIGGLTLGEKASVTTLIINILSHLAFILLYKLNLLADYEVVYSEKIWMARTVNFILLNIVIVITNITYIRVNKKILTQSDETRRATIIGLAKLAEYRDTDTGEHLQRIRSFTMNLAELLKSTEKYSDYITDDYVWDISMSAILHDIGKVGIQDDILLKPDSLTEEEFHEIKKHPLYGSDVIGEIEKNIQGRSLYKLGKEIATHHHERWDGSGYPEGLAGEKIPLSARIVALTDVYDALTHKRPYKEAYSTEEAIGIISRERGRHFDPFIVDIFLENKELFEKLSSEMRNGS